MLALIALSQLLHISARLKGPLSQVQRSFERAEDSRVLVQSQVFSFRGRQSQQSQRSCAFARLLHASHPPRNNITYNAT